MKRTETGAIAGAPDGVATLAERLKRPRRTVLRWIVKLHADDEKRGKGGWLFSLGPAARGRRYHVDLDGLRRLHPRLFQRRYYDEAETESLEDRVKLVEDAARQNAAKLTMVAARVRAASEKKSA